MRPRTMDSGHIPGWQLQPRRRFVGWGGGHGGQRLGVDEFDLSARILTIRSMDVKTWSIHPPGGRCAGGSWGGSSGRVGLRTVATVALDIQPRVSGRERHRNPSQMCPSFTWSRWGRLLLAIASQYDVTWTRWSPANDLDGPGASLAIGQRLVIPKDSAMLPDEVLPRPYNSHPQCVTIPPASEQTTYGKPPPCPNLLSLRASMRPSGAL